ncbi:MAG TPA: 3'-5' exonuclease, partial [Candidatus Syntrophosphaera sp.]|nr:3'-5' exonuclease [Candidatus Syntrophosphaera sp.]
MEPNDIPPLSDRLNYVAFDTETTGLDPKTDELIELAAVRFRGGEVTERFSTLVRPRGKVPKFIQYLTHIDPQELKDAPDAETALKQFFSFIGDDILVAHNAGFDIGFVNHHSALHGGDLIQHPVWDTVEIARTYLPFTTDHRLGTLTAHFGIT